MVTKADRCVIIPYKGELPKCRVDPALQAEWEQALRDARLALGVRPWYNGDAYEGVDVPSTPPNR